MTTIPAKYSDPASACPRSSLIQKWREKLPRVDFSWPEYVSFEGEIRKIGHLRILLGVVLLVRFGEIAHSYLIYAQVTPLPTATVLRLVLLFLALASFTVGFCTPWATLVTAIVAVQSDQFFGTHTLGTDVLIGLLFALFLINAGQRLSIDAALVRSNNSIARFLGLGARTVRCVSITELKYAYRCVIIFYALLSFPALVYHLRDSYWQEGLTLKSLLTNSYLSKHYRMFRELDAAMPGCLSILSIGASIGQTIFQLFMLPLLCFRPGRWFVVVWGSTFFTISLLCINLSYLPHVEIIIWLLVFFPYPSSWGDSEAGQASFATGLSSQKRPSRISTETLRIGFLFTALTAFMLVCLVFVVAEVLPGLNPKLAPSWRSRVQPLIRSFGFFPPDVFNGTDLMMGDHWIELYARENNDWKLVPIIGTEGQRLSYLPIDILNFKNHNSDFLYFGTTLQFAREFIHGKRNPTSFFSEPNFGWQNLERLIRYDYLFRRRKGTVVYRARVRGNRSSDVRHWKAALDRFQSNILFESQYKFDLQESLRELPLS